MPGFDATGPTGQGPRTGRGLGRCGGTGQAQGQGGMGRGGGRGFGQGGRGRRGFRNMFNLTGLTGRQRTAAEQTAQEDAGEPTPREQTRDLPDEDTQSAQDGE